MTRSRFATLLLCCPIALGCARTADAPANNPNADLTTQQRVIRITPALQRTIGQNDLNNLRTYMQFVHAETGRYPTTIAQLPPDVQRDLPALYKAIQDGEVVLAGGQGGVLAYEAAALQERGSVLTTDGIQAMTADELRQRLGMVG